MHIRLTSELAWELPDCCNRKLFTYVIASGEFIKIGFTVRIARRLHELNAYCPSPIQILGIGRGGALESFFHKRCASYWVHNEWFRIEAWELIKDYFVDPDKCASCVLEMDSSSFDPA